MRDERDWLSRYHDGKRAIGPIIGRLDKLSRAFHTVGNSTMSEELFSMAEDLEKIREQIDKAIGDNINENFKQSQESTGLMLKAALAGVLGPKVDDQEGQDW